MRADSRERNENRWCWNSMLDLDVCDLGGECGLGEELDAQEILMQS
jgi:hypothetical protein